MIYSITISNCIILSKLISSERLNLLLNLYRYFLSSWRLLLCLLSLLPPWSITSHLVNCVPVSTATMMFAFPRLPNSRISLTHVHFVIHYCLQVVFFCRTAFWLVTCHLCWSLHSIASQFFKSIPPDCQDHFLTLSFSVLVTLLLSAHLMSVLYSNMKVT